MKKVLKIVLLLFCLIFSLEMSARAQIVTYEFNAKYEIQNGKIKNSSGKSIQTFEIKNNKIYLLSACQKDYEWHGQDEHQTDFVPTLYKNDYFIGYYTNGINHKIIQIDKDLTCATIYNWSGLDNHCTVWYGKSITSKFIENK